MCPASVTARQEIRNSPVKEEAGREEWAEMSGRCFILLGMQKDRERPGMPLPPSCIAQKVWPSRIGQADEDLGRNSQCQRVYQCSSWPGAAERRVLLRARSRQKGPAGKGKGQMRTGLSCKLSKVFRVYVMTFYALL